MFSRVTRYITCSIGPAYGIRRSLCILKVALWVGLASLAWLGCENDMTKVQELIKQEQVQVETGRDVEIVYSELGNIKARVIAPRMDKHYGDEPNTEFPEGLTVYNYGDSLELVSKMQANYGINYEKKEEILVRDDVILVNTEGEKLNSEELTWSRAKKKIYSDKFVKITTPEEIIVGEGFEANEDFSEYTIKKITGRFSVEADVVE